jgi:hypothetical protein
MATDVHLDHEYHCGVDAFWDKVFFDDEYNRRLYAEALRFPKYEKLSQEDRGTTIFRRVRATPPQEAPAAIQSLMGGAFYYEEEATFDKATKVLRFKTIPSKLAEKIKIDGTMRTTPSGARLRRIVDVRIEVKIFGVGGMVEGFVAKTVKESFDRGARFTNDFLREKGLAT